MESQNDEKKGKSKNQSPAEFFAENKNIAGFDNKLYITENGIGELNNSSLSLQEALVDTTRINYHYHHLSFLKEAIQDGVDVRGYFAWSLLDNFEWGAGYTIRYGFNFVDFNNGLKRHAKNSALWFKNFLKK